MEPWKRITTGDPVIEELQDNAEPIMRRVEQVPLMGGTLVKGQFLTATDPYDTHIFHGLGRAPEGWIIVRQRSRADIWDVQDSNRSPEKTLVLNTSANVTVDLWVF